MGLMNFGRGEGPRSSSCSGEEFDFWGKTEHSSGSSELEVDPPSNLFASGEAERFLAFVPTTWRSSGLPL